MNLVNANHADLATKLAQVFEEESLWSDKEHFDLLLLNGFNNLSLHLVA